MNQSGSLGCNPTVVPGTHHDVPATGIEQGSILWSPRPEQIEPTRLAAYMRWLAAEHGLHFDSYDALWRWSVDELEAFWESIWDFFGVQADGVRDPVLGSRAMPGAQWYPNARLNYAEHVFRCATADRPALIARREDAPTRETSWAELERDTGALAGRLRALGIGPGDRVASYLPNRPETVVAFLACASLGAIWSSCAPDMGAIVVLDRFRQIEPKLLFAVDSYTYNGKAHDRSALVDELLRELPSVQHVIHLPGPLSRSDPAAHLSWRDCLPWNEALAQDAALQFQRLPFGHPLWIVYSSGTTGLPKAIVHGHGGIVLTHLKTLALQHDLRPGDRLLFLGGTGWIVWNLQLGALLTGASIVLYDGNPAWPDSEALWRFMDEHRVTLFGCGAAFLVNCMKDGLRPRDVVALQSLRAINATGSPLPIDAYRWVYDAVKPDVWLASVSGGTDIASGFVACAPTLPVTAGEIQCRELGVAAHAFNEAGESVIDEVGELVITQSMPSMPVFFWNDPEDDSPHGADGAGPPGGRADDSGRPGGVGRRYRESYFEMYPGVWRHGDWIRFTPRGTSVIYGRSDSTINRHGIRMGTAEIYRVVEELPEVRDSMVVDLEYLGRPSFMPLFVVLTPGSTLDAALRARITQQIRSKASPRHVPNEIYQVEEIPRTLTGKKMEVPVRRLLLGARPEKVASADAMANPRSFDFFVRLAKQMNGPETT
jgi:acetoacetyl-CoA synthetase